MESYVNIYWRNNHKRFRDVVYIADTGENKLILENTSGRRLTVEVNGDVNVHACGIGLGDGSTRWRRAIALIAEHDGKKYSCKLDPETFEVLGSKGDFDAKLLNVELGR